MSGALKRDEWETTKWYSLKDLSVTKLEYGSGASAIPYDEDVRYLRITDITVDGSLTEDFVSPNVYDSKYLLKEDDLLFARTGATVGKTLLFKEKYGKCIYAGFLIRLVPNKDLVVPEYLYYFTKSPRYLAFVQKSMKVVAQPNINAKQYGDLKIPLPPLDIQRRIADVLDKVTELIDLRKKQLEKLDELVKARFVEMFGDVALNPNGYPVKDFDEISVLITDGEHATPRRTEEGIYLLSARNVLNHTLQLDDVDYIDEEEYNRIARRVIPQAGDVLISCSGSIGRCCVVPDGLKFQMVRSAALIRFDDTINPIFAEWLITSDDLQRQIAQSATQSSQANLFQGKIRKLHGYVPPMELQDQFVAFLKQTDKSKVIIQQSLDTLETLQKSLMQEYFG